MDLTAPCNWPAAACPACDGMDCVSAVQRIDLEAWAVQDLWEATGRVFGTCPVSVLPCGDHRTLCGVCWSSFRSCGCRNVPEIKLPGPVDSVTAVVVDGVTLADDTYRIDDYQWLVRLDGGTWPVNADPLDPDSFRVDYLQGIDPPAGAGSVAGMLVCSRAGCVNKGCRVPRNTQQISRQGVTMIRGGGALTSRPWRYFPDIINIFGIQEVDEWVRNATAPLMAGAVHSPDLPSVRRITWEATP